MFAKSFKLVFGIGSAVVATLSLAGAAIGAFWLIGYLVQNPAAEAANDARRLAQAVRLRDAVKDALCETLPPVQNKFLEYLDDLTVEEEATMTVQQKAARELYARANERNRDFVAQARNYCK